MKINFYATLRPVVGGKTIDLPLPAGATVQALLDRLLETYPGLRPHMYDPQGQLYPHVHFFINGRDAQYLAGGFGAVLTAEDTVNIFPPVGGGGPSGADGD
jgi:molybdopterin synthase sulfur carrier subunit